MRRVSKHNTPTRRKTFGVSLSARARAQGLLLAELDGRTFSNEIEWLLRKRAGEVIAEADRGVVT